MRHLIVAPVIALILLWVAKESTAADIRLTDDAEYGCLVTLDGPIAAGDTETLLAVMKRAATDSLYADTIWYNDYGDGSPPEIDFRTPLHLCLNSPGGSLAEAVKITETVNGRLGTMIRPGARCESACALVFMAGSFDTGSDFGTLPSRHLHVLGQLGFHAPSLTVPDGSYDAQTVARAYAISVQATELIFRNLVKFQFAPSLAARMHSTPPEDMFYVSTVREAARWGISVIGVDRPSSFDDGVIKIACGNLYRATTDMSTSDPDLWLGGGYLGNTVTRPDRVSFAYEGFGAEAAGVCEGRFYDPGDEFTFGTQFWGPARAIQASVWGDGGLPEAVPSLNYGIFQTFMAYPGEARLSALPRDGKISSSAQQGTCYVFNSEDVLIDQDPCTQTRRVQADARIVDIHSWPSGARTAVEQSGLGYRINGGPALLSYWPDAGPEPASVLCLRSERTTNRFCFAPQ